MWKCVQIVTDCNCKDTGAAYAEPLPKHKFGHIIPGALSKAGACLSTTTTEECPKHLGGGLKRRRRRVPRTRWVVQKNDDDGTANGPRGGRKKRRQEDTSRSGRRGCHASHGTRWSLRCSFERQRPTSAGVRFGTLFLHQFGTVWVLDDETGTIRTGISR